MKWISRPWIVTCSVAIASVTAAFLLTSSSLHHQVEPPSPSEQVVQPRNNMASTIGNMALRQAKSDALFGMLIADAIAMPVHWYYNPQDIHTGYNGWLTGYRAPNKKHPSSILSLSAVDGSGRSGWHKKSRGIVGDVILHDKLPFWKAGRTTHYHQGMQAGDNTLNSHCALEMMKTIQRVDPTSSMPQRHLQAAVLEDYVKFMTTPGTHNDTYAESWHRAFFRDWVQEDEAPTTSSQLIQFAEKRSKKLLAGPPDSQLPSIGAFVIAIPWIIHSAHKSSSECAESAVAFLRLTHPEASLEPQVRDYAELLHAVINGADLFQEIEKVLSSQKFGSSRRKKELITRFSQEAKHLKGHPEEQLEVYQEAIGSLGMACYIEGATASMLFLAREFHDNFEAGVLTNANCGGENCHRGAALGALLGAAAAVRGQHLPPSLKDGLHSSKPSIQDINSKL